MRSVLVFAAILAAAFDTRTVIAAISPIADHIDDDLALGIGGLSLLAALPPLAFAAFAVVAPSLVRRIGLERTMTVALVMILLGHIGRTFALSGTALIVATVVCLGGVGIANVVLPPLVRRYFPAVIGGATALYVTLQSLGTGAPPLLGVPLTEAFGWREALGIWAIVATVAVVLWVLVVPARPALPDADTGIPLPGESPATPRGRVWRSRIAWAVALLFAVAAGHAYAAMAWLPAVLIDRSGMTPGEAGATLALFGAIGVLPALTVPILAARMRNVSTLIVIGFVILLSGYLGLLFAPQVIPVLWAALTGAGAAFFALCLVLVNLRTKSVVGTVRMSGFVQTVGYLSGAIGPLLFGLLHEATGTWLASLVVFACSTVVAFGAALVLRRPGFVEDQWLRRLPSQ